jgi:hypothetical protein
MYRSCNRRVIQQRKFVNLATACLEEWRSQSEANVLSVTQNTIDDEPVDIRSNAIGCSLNVIGSECSYPALGEYIAKKWSIGMTIHGRGLFLTYMISEAYWIATHTNLP